MPKVLVQGVNLNETAPWDGEASVLPPGEYAFEVVDAIIKEAKTSEKFPSLVLDLVVTGGADSEQYNGVKRKHFVSLSPNAAGRLRNIIDACHVPIEADGGFTTETFLGTGFIAEAYEDTYEKPDLASGNSVTKTVGKIHKERPIESGWSGAVAEGQPQAAPQAPQAPQAAPQQPAAPTAPAAPQAPAAPRAATAPRVAAGNPPRRPPIPPRRAN